MSHPEAVRFEFRRYNASRRFYQNDLVAKLPGLIITQFVVSQPVPIDLDNDHIALRFDFFDDWYNVMAFLDVNGDPTGHYRVSIQTPLQNEAGIWKGDDLLLGLEIMPEFKYSITGESDFLSAVEEGWMKIYSAANARDALRSLCQMVDGGTLPQEVMDAVHG